MDAAAPVRSACKSRILRSGRFDHAARNKGASITTDPLLQNREILSAPREASQTLIPLNKLSEGPDKELRLRLVLDTNVLLSLLMFRDPRFEALERLWQKGEILLLGDDAVYAELERVSTYPQFSARPAPDLKGYREAVEWIPGSGGGRRLPLCRDPDDQKFLELAARGGADSLVTEDRALLRVKKKGVPFEIETPLRLLGRLELSPPRSNGTHVPRAAARNSDE